MIYLDNSATTFPKPQTVRNAVSAAMAASANPGRSGHPLSLAAARKIYSVRQTAAEFFGMENEARVIFVRNCTEGLNIALKGLLHRGDHVVVSSLEHNAVMRPLEKLSGIGVKYTKARIFAGDDDSTIDSFRRAINKDTRMIVCTHASNVWGIRLPVERLCALAHTYGLLFVLDAAQSAGVLPLSMADGYDVVCCAGHKGLYGPMGTGLMLLSEGVDPDTLTEGGTGSNSFSLVQPEDLPDRYESGTPDLSGIAGLGAGIGFVMGKGREKISSHEFSLITRLYDRLNGKRGVVLYTDRPSEEYSVPVLSFNIEGMHSEEAAAALGRKGIAVRAGLHCAPCAHEFMKTEEIGAVRISPSVFTARSEIDRTAQAVIELADQRKPKSLRL